MEPTISEKLIELVFSAIEHGIESVRTAGSPITPFAMISEGENQSLHRFAAEGGIKKAKKYFAAHIAALPPEAIRYAIAADAVVTIGDRPHDAIVIEAGERGQESAHLFAQRYRPANEHGPLVPFGNPVYMGETKLLFK